MELVWANCRRYNGEGSPLDLQAQSAAAAMARRWRKARLPLPEADAGACSLSPFTAWAWHCLVLNPHVCTRCADLSLAVALLLRQALPCHQAGLEQHLPLCLVSQPLLEG